MKKNINISGIIFHIEEEGYDKMMEYLETARRSAAFYNAPTVIMAEIENKIAEIFLNRLKEGAQFVTVEDVADLTSGNKGFIVSKNIRMANCIYLF
jgi:hypothetical protein